MAPARSVSGVSPNQMLPAKEKEKDLRTNAAPAPSSSSTPTASTSTSSANASAAALKGSASAFALSMRARAKAASERAAASIKAADLGGVWHGAVDAAGAALAATEEKIRKLSAAAAAAGASSSASSSASLAALCKSEAASRPCPRLVLSACCSIAAEAGKAASERAFVADAPLELAGFVLAELDDAAGVALPPPGTSPAIMATVLKHFLASLPEPLLPAKCLPGFIGAGMRNAPASAAAAAAAALPPGPSGVLSLLVETLSRVATAGEEDAGVSGAPTPAELAASLVPCISWHPGAPRPAVSYPSSFDGGAGSGGNNGSQPPSPAAGGGSSSKTGSAGLPNPSRAELTPGEAAAVARAVEILILTAADRAAGGGGLGGGGGGFGFGGGAGGSFGGSGAASFGSEPASPMGFFGGNGAAGGGGGGEEGGTAEG